MHLYVIIYTHKHGTDAWAHFAANKPTEEEIIEELRGNGEWDEGDDDRGSTIEIRGTFENPHADALRAMVESYDSTGCEDCGVVHEAEYEAAKKVLGL